MGRGSCSHYLPLCSPSSGRACQRSFVLTIAANEQNCWEIRSLLDGAALRVAPLPPPAFSKVAGGLVFRNVAIQNSFENGEHASRRGLPSAARRSSETLVIENNQAPAEHPNPHWQRL